MIEIEQKFDVPAGFAVPSLTGPGVAGKTPPDVLHLSATYFDTAGLRLTRAKITLRRRTGGTDAGWHIKLPVSADTRRELHFPLDEAEHEVPSAVAAQVAKWTGREPLRPVARLDTRRTVRRLLDQSGQPLAEIADDEVTGSRPDPADPARWRQADSWREVEVELVSGTRFAERHGRATAGGRSRAIQVGVQAGPGARHRLARSAEHVFDRAAGGG